METGDPLMDDFDEQLLASDRRLEAMLRRREIRPPFVTIVVTVYNYERYVVGCLRSIAEQTYRNFMCLVVDDCSRDRSAELVDNFIAEQGFDGRFQQIRHETNRGQMAGFKTGFENARGEFLVFVDADDLLLPDFLAIHLTVHLGALLPVAFTSSDQYQINDAGEVIAGQHADLQARGRYRHVGSHYLFANSWPWATTSSMMFRRATLHLILPDDPEPFRICADNYICHFGNLVGGSLLIPGRHGCYRRHGSNFFSNNRIVGGQHPTGDMRKHPHHESIRQAVVNHLLSYSDRFIGVLAGWWFLVLLARTITFREALRIAFGSTWSRSICMSRQYILPFLYRSLANRIRWRNRWLFHLGPSISLLPKKVFRNKPDAPSRGDR